MSDQRWIVYGWWQRNHHRGYVEQTFDHEVDAVAKYLAYDPNDYDLCSIQMANYRPWSLRQRLAVRHAIRRGQW